MPQIIVKHDEKTTWTAAENHWLSEVTGASAVAICPAMSGRMTCARSIRSLWVIRWLGRLWARLGGVEGTFFGWDFDDPEMPQEIYMKGFLNGFFTCLKQNLGCESPLWPLWVIYSWLFRPLVVSLVVVWLWDSANGLQYLTCGGSLNSALPEDCRLQASLD